VIDIHAHLTFSTRPNFLNSQLGAEQVVDRMNRDGITRAVLLPMESPEADCGLMLTEDILDAVHRYPERFIAFMHLDPRVPALEEQIEYFATQHRCKGFGEMLDGLAIDDPLHKRIYAKCAELGLPVLFDMRVDICWAEPGLPRLEKCLREFPDCIFIGHGPAWWAAISADDDGSDSYPSGPITPTGAADRLLSEYDNMWADISAMSGYNALTRDPEFTEGFIDRHWGKLMFGTDRVRPGEDLRHVSWMRDTAMTEAQRQAIAEGNATRLLQLG